MKFASSKQSGARRQDPISCSLCRRKKLRCNRQHPCANCVARNVPCERESSLPVTATAAPTQPQYASPTDTTAIGDGAILTKLDRLESLILQMSSGQQNPANTFSLSIPQQPTPDTVTSPFDAANANEAAHKVDTKRLEDVGTRENLMLSGLSDGLHFEIVTILQMVTTDVRHLYRPTTALNAPRIILIPTLKEALILLDLYAEHVEYLHHILIISKVRQQIYSFYSYLSHPSDFQQNHHQHGPIPSALAPSALILSIFASTAACLAEICSKASTSQQSLNLPSSSRPLSLMTIPQARATSIQWAKAAFDCLDHARHIGSGCLEDVQAMILVFFLVYNLEGFSARARTGMGHGISVARDLGLHRIDYAGDRQQGKDNDNGGGRWSDPAETELARRVWWHIAATDWLLSLSGGPQEGVYNIQPRHMHVNMPRNINDSDLVDRSSPPDLDLPLNVPTSMSYLIQRIKLATICRNIVDAMPMSPSTPDTIPYEEFIRLDREFEKFLDDLPPFFQLQKVDWQGLRQMEQLQGQRTTKRLRSATASASASAGSEEKVTDTDVQTQHITTQSFMIRLTSHTRRCKLHQPFLVRGFTDPKYRYSRDVCLKSARVVLGVQQELEREGAIAMGLLGLSGINHHLFFATIALVMDLCFNREEGPDREEREKERKEEVWRACRILEDAKERSLVAKRFLDSLMDVLRKHRVKLIDGPAAMGMDSSELSGMVDAQLAELQNEAALDIPGGPSEPQPSDFEEIWQTYIDNAPNFDVPEWEELFNELDTQLG